MPSSTLATTLLTIAMIGAFALVFGGIAIIRRGDRQKGVLMIGVAIVVVGNVLIWTV
ncbi:membrane protein [Sphingomonas sp. 37zxx]|uniref:membrane protein n=1 Tax=Sphingomonas sp. 37zxx TaxID=1550073 RepID=UPI00053BF8AA|nr:membrane protein [Sphingomonas sp. 37zxx]